MRTPSFSKIFSLFLAVLLGALLGFLIIAQMNTGKRLLLSSQTIEPTVQLTQTLQKMRQEEEKLKTEVSRLQESVEQKSQTLQRQKQDVATVAKNLEDEKRKLGLTRVTGEGVIITLSDAEYGIGGDETDRAISHAVDILDIVNVLSAAGAKAITVNAERIVDTTAIVCVGNTILVNNIPIGAPYTIVAVGSPAMLRSTLTDEKNLPSLHDRNRNFGLGMTATDAMLDIPAFQGRFPSRYIRTLSLP